MRVTCHTNYFDVYIITVCKVLKKKTRPKPGGYIQLTKYCKCYVHNTHEDNGSNLPLILSVFTLSPIVLEGVMRVVKQIKMIPF